MNLNNNNNSIEVDASQIIETKKDFESALISNLNNYKNKFKLYD